MNLRLKDVFAKLKNILRSPSYSRTFLLLGIVVLAIIIPVTVIVLQQQTQTRQHASSNLCVDGHGVCVPYGTCKAEGMTCVGGLGCPGGTGCYGYSAPPQKPTYTCQPNNGSSWPGCRPPGICTSENGLEKIGGTCPQSTVCCQPAPKPTPNPKITCTTYKNNSYRCTDYINKKETCGTNFYSGSSDCTGYGSLCCPKAEIIIPKLPTGTICTGQANGSSITEHGICFYEGDTKDGSLAHGKPNFTTDINKRCTSGCYTDGWYQSCTQMLSTTNGVETTGHSIPNNNSCSLNPGGAVCCTLGSSPSTTSPTPKPTNTELKVQSTGIVCGAQHNGICYDWNSVSTQPVICPKGMMSTYQTKTNSNDGTACGNWQSSNGQTAIACCQPIPPIASNAIRCGQKNTGVCYWHYNIPPSAGSGPQCTTDVTTNVSDACWENDTSPFPSCNILMPGSTIDIKGKGQCINSPQAPSLVNSDAICCIPPSTGSSNKGNPSGGGGGGGGPTCTNGHTTQIALSLKLPGIGAGNFENNSPKHPNRTAFFVTVTDQNGNTVYPKNTTIAFNYASGRFNSNKINLGTSLTCGNTYTVSVKLPTYLTATAQITYGADQTINMDPYVGDINKVDPTTGAIVGDGTIDIKDYSILVQCRNSDPTAPITFKDGPNSVNVTCGDLINFFDYPDGGTQGDEWAYNYNLWLRSYIKANGY